MKFGHPLLESLAQAKLWAHAALCRASAARAGGRDATIFASDMHVCVNARFLVRVPVHGVGESARPSQKYRQ